MAKQKPRHTIRVGRGIKASIWENSSQNGTWHNATLSRTYKDKDGKLQDTSSFTRDDLPFARIAVEKAFDFMLALKEATTEDTE